MAESFVKCKFEMQSYRDTIGDIDQETLWVDGQWMGHPANNKDFAHLCRYLSYVFGIDSIDRDKLRHSFKKAIKRLESFALDDIRISSEVSTVTIYGVIDRKNIVFTPRHFEYDKMVKTHQMGSISVLDADEGEMRFEHNKFSLGTMYFGKLLSVFNDVRLGNDLLMKKGHIRGVCDSPMNVFLVKNLISESPAGTLCLVDYMYDLCEVNWKQINDFVDPKAKYVGIVDKNSHHKIQPLIDDLNLHPLKNVLMAPDGGCIVARIYGHDGEAYSSWLSPYVATIRDGDGHTRIVGLAIDTLAYPGGSNGALINYLNS